MMFVRTPTHFYVMRFLLGAAEAGFFPAVILHLSHWFPLAQRGRALSRFYMCGALGSILMGGVSGPLLDLDHTWGLRGWQWLFLVQGLPAVVLAAVIFFALPESPSHVRWLTDEEKAAVEKALASDDHDVGHHDRHDMLAILRLPRVLLLGVIGLFTIGAFMTLYLSAPMVLAERTGLSRDHVGYLVSGGGALGMIGMLTGGWYGDRTGDRFRPFYVSTAVFGLAIAVMAIAPSPVIVAVAYLIGMGFWTTVTLSCITVTTSVVQRRHVAVAIAAMNSLSQIGAFTMPYAWGALKDKTGTFTIGLYSLAVCLAIALVLIAVLQRLVARGRLSKVSTNRPFSSVASP